MKWLLIIEFLLLPMIFIGCVITGSSNFKSSADYHKFIDSTDAKYQIDSFHPKRTIEYLKPTLNKLAVSISDILNNPRVKSKVFGKSLSFYLLPSGNFKRCGFTDFPDPDSQTMKDTSRLFVYYRSDSTLNALTDSIASLFKTDSIPGYKPNLWINGLIKNEFSKFIFSFKDTSYYTLSHTGGRSRASIMRVVMQKIGSLRDAYNRKLRSSPGIKGKIAVKYAIDEFGHVVFAEIVPTETTINDPALQNEFVVIIKSWQFGRISKPGDITEVVYPFALSQ
jgi:hypothetical protein